MASDDVDATEPSSPAARTREWVSLVLVILATGFFAWRSVVDGQRAYPAILILCVVGFIWWSWPGKQKGPHISNRDAVVEAGEHGAIIYWRPG